MSTTVIDALLVTLGLDATNFNQNADTVKKTQKKLSDQAGLSAKQIEQQEKKLAAAQAARAKELEARSKQIAQGLSKIRNQALGLLAVFTAGVGLKNFAIGTINTGASLGRLSTNLNMTIEKLSAYGQASERAGGTVEGMNAQLKESADTIARIKNGQEMSEGLQWFFRMGGSSDALKDGNTYLLARADIIAKMAKTDPTGAMLAAQNMGISEDQFNFIKQGSSLIEQQVAEREKLARFTRKDAEDAEKLRKQMLDLKQSLELTSTKILLELAPSLIKVADAILEAIAQYKKWTGNEEETPGVKKFGPLRFGKKEDLDKDDATNGRKPLPGATGSRSSSGKITMAPSADASAGSDKKLPRGMRNNNPGNIEYGPFAKRHGATGSDGRFAIFPTMEAGQAAQKALLGGYISSGSNTIRKAITKWAPSSENNTEAYVNAVSKQMGIGADQALNSSHIPALVEAIGRHENGAAYANAMGAVNMTSRAASGARTENRGNTSTSTTDVKVGTITVQTQATDATGIARSIGAAVTKHGFVSQANTGLS